MSTRKVFVVGAGLAGLSAAVKLAIAGQRIELIEAAPQAGGRCRSYFDSTLGQVIDNGNHLVLSGNRSTMAYLKAIGAEPGLEGPADARISFINIANGERWTIAPNAGPVPFWLLDAHARVPGTKPADYVALGRLLFAGQSQTISETIRCDGPLWERLLKPFFLAALNTQPEQAAAVLAGALVRETFARGGRAYRPRIAHPNLAPVFVNPALSLLRRAGSDIRLGDRLRRIAIDRNNVVELELQSATLALTPNDAVVLATPPWVTAELLPDIVVPDKFSSIVNAHFRIDPPSGVPSMLGVLGGLAEWIFAFKRRISVTISGAERLIDSDREELAHAIWIDVCAAHNCDRALPPWQIVKEKRATFAATPEQNKKRASAKTKWSGLYLAGDWTDTGLPATIEGAIRSGKTAAELALCQS